LCLVIPWGLTLLGQPAPLVSRAIDWIQAQAGKKDLQIAPGSGQILWGQDSTTQRWEALVLLSPKGKTIPSQLVRLFQNAKGKWRMQLVPRIPEDLKVPLCLKALPAGILAESYGGPPLHVGQDPAVPSVPLEFHLNDCEDEGLPNPAEIFHPRFGLALVVNAIVDDSKDPSLEGQRWATHGRGESTDLPLSALHSGVRVVDRWQGRVWFRMGTDLFAICAEGWRAPWPRVKPRKQASPS